MLRHPRQKKRVNDGSGCSDCPLIGGQSELINQEYDDGTDHVYYNADIVNHTPQPIPVQFLEERSEAILSNPSEYYLSVIRFRLPGNLIPLFHFPPINPFFVTFSRSGIDFSFPVNFIPVTSSTTPFLGSENNPVFFYQQMLDSINQALHLAYLAVNAAGPPFDIFFPPVMWYNETNQLFYLRTRNDQFSPSFIGPDVVDIWFTSNLFNLFNTMHGFIQGFNRLDLKDFRVFIQNNVNNVPPNIPFPNTDALLDMRTEVNIQYAWEDISKIFITSVSLNINMEEIKSANNSGINITRPIVKDFEPIVSGDFRTNNVFQYQPSSNWILIDLLSNDPLRKLDLQFFWESKNGSIFPFIVPPQMFATVKLMFVRKKKFFQTF